MKRTQRRAGLLLSVFHLAASLADALHSFNSSASDAAKSHDFNSALIARTVSASGSSL